MFNPLLPEIHNKILVKYRPWNKNKLVDRTWSISN